jgi:hypothetical protein
MAGNSGALLSSQLIREVQIGESQCRTARQDLFSKITNTKRVGGEMQVVEHLHSKCEALSSSPTTAKKRAQI